MTRGEARRVLDASVAVKCYVREDGSDEAMEAVREAGSLVAPELIVAEVCNTAWKKLRRGEIESVQAERMLRALPGLFDRLVPSATLSARALEIATELDHPAYDALYLALAEAEEAPLVSDDTRLLRRVRGTSWEARLRPLRGWPAG